MQTQQVLKTIRPAKNLINQQTAKTNTLTASLLLTLLMIWPLSKSLPVDLASWGRGLGGRPTAEKTVGQKMTENQGFGKMGAEL